MKRKELIFICAVLFLCAVLALIWALTGKSGKTAVISVDSKTVKKIDLESAENGEFTLDTIEGAVFEILDKQIRVKSSDCPDKICVKTGFISKTREKIICMPKRLIIEIEE